MIRSVLLPFARAKPIVAYCLHMAAGSLASRHTTTATTASALPTLLSRTYTPLIAKAALLRQPGVDLDWATAHGDLGLLDLMLQWSKEPDGRPVNYSPRKVVSLAFQQPDSQVIDWWLDKSDLLVDWEWDDARILKAFCNQDRGLAWFEWWKARGFPRLEDRVTFPKLLVHVSQEGRVDLLDWLLEHVGVDPMVTEDASDNPIVAAAQRGRVHVLDWWLDKAHQTVSQLDWMQAYSAALQSKQVAVVKWCISRPQVLEALQREIKAAGASSDAPSVYTTAFRNDLVHLLDWGALDAQENSLRSAEACKAGDLSVVKALHAKGQLIGTPQQLVQSAIESGNLELMDWIHCNIDAKRAPPFVTTVIESWVHPFALACSTGNVATLDWLLAKGFSLPSGWGLGLAFETASDHGDIAVLDWLLNNGLGKLEHMARYTWGSCLKAAGYRGHVHILDQLVSKVYILDPAQLFTAKAGLGHTGSSVTSLRTEASAL